MRDLPLTVVVPTYNRKDFLSKSLKSLSNQTLPSSQFEVIVIDDGSSDGTASMLERLISNLKLEVSYFHQTNHGPATARNVGIKKAQGQIILFIGDDTIAKEDLLEQHINWHGQFPDLNIAILGKTTWTKDKKITPFMYWLENGGPQYKYWSIEDYFNVGYVHFYTSNVSLKADFLLEHGLFDEEFPFASYEDIELAKRLEAKGLRIIYNDQAVGYHDHFTSLSSAVRRMRQVGKSQLLYLRKIGENPNQKPKRTALIELAASLKFSFLLKLGKLLENRVVSHSMYNYLMDKAMYQGFYNDA